MLEKLERELMLLSRHQVLVRRERDPERLERSAYLLLSRIDTQGPMSIGELAEAFGLDTSTVNRQTAALLRCGLAERVADPGGGMARKLRITAEGARRPPGTAKSTGPAWPGWSPTGPLRRCGSWRTSWSGSTAAPRHSKDGTGPARRRRGKAAP